MTTLRSDSAGEASPIETPTMLAELAVCEQACRSEPSERALAEMFNSLCEKYPQWHVPHRVLGLHYLPTNPDKALRELQAAEALAPNDLQTLLALVRVYIQLRHYALATNKLQVARQIALGDNAEMAELSTELAKKSNDLF